MSIADYLARPHAPADFARAAKASRATCELVDLLAVPEKAWRDLAARAADSNVFFHPDWARAVALNAEGKSGAQALIAWDSPMRGKLIGLLPVISAWSAYKIPVPALVAWEAYAPLTTPLLDRDCVEASACGLVAAAQNAGASALILPAFGDGSIAAAALRRAVATFGQPRVLNSHQRACLDATQPPDDALETLGAKKLKELRRQRNRLADSGEVSFAFADVDQAGAALNDFLSLEAAGWKGARGTALGQKNGDRAFVREAVTAMLQSGHAQLARLRSGDKTVAAGIVLRHLTRGYFFKIAYDESLAKSSPGVQITLDITRALCADAAIESVDSIAVADHPMIDHVWRARLPICDLLLPVRRDAFSFAAISLSIAARHATREAAKRGVHFVRSLKGKRP